MNDLYPSRLHSKPALSKRFDPIVYADMGDRSPVSRQAIETYKRDGVMVLEDVFSPAEIAAFKREANALRQNTSTLSDETIVSEPGAEGEKVVRSVFAIHEQSQVMHRLASDERLAGLARYILNDEVYLHQSRMNYKPAFQGKEFYWHSDFETWHSEDGMPRMRTLSMSVMLTDNHSQAGPTMFIPGSQNVFVQCVGETPDDHYKQSLRKQEFGVPDADILKDFVDQGGIIAPTPKAGSVVVFDCNVMHGSSGNITPFERTNAFFVFNAWSNKLVAPFGGTKPRPEYIAHRNTKAPLVQAVPELAD